VVVMVAVMVVVSLLISRVAGRWFRETNSSWALHVWHDMQGCDEGDV
jgi:hypothetical protein